MKFQKWSLLFFAGVTLISFGLSASAFANKEKKDLKVEEKQVRGVMQGIATSLENIIPYIVSEIEFKKNENKKFIEKSLKDIKDTFIELKGHGVINQSGLIINQEVISEQLSQVESLYRNSNYDFARYKFLSSLNLCVSCHSQSESKSVEQIFADKNKKNLNLGTFEKAEYLYITRRYDEALPIYDQYIFEFRKTDDDEKLFRSFERKLNFFVRVKRDYKSARFSFLENLKNKEIPNRVRAEVNDWIKILSGKSLWENFEAKKVTEEEMGKFISTFIVDNEDGPIFTITDSTEVLDMDLASILIEYYNTHPQTKYGAQILYWMAMIDKRLNDDLFYSLGDLYLVQCMEKHSADPIAKECFESYLEDIEFIYVTKKKKQIPKELLKKIEDYKKLVKYTDIAEQ